MYRSIVAALLLVVLSLTPALAKSHRAGASPPPGQASSATMPSCAASDPVVWVNTSSRVYHMPGTKYYGKTKHGKYECRSAATSQGFKEAAMKRQGPMNAPAPATTR